MTDERAVQVLREKFAKADAKRERWLKIAWAGIFWAVIWFIVWGVARSL